MTSSEPSTRATRLAAYFALARSHPLWFQTPADGIQIITDAEEIARIESEIGERYSQRGQPAAWAEIGVQYQDPYLIVLRDAVRFPDGSAGVHHRTLRLEGEPSGVAILPLLDDRMVMVRHYRHPTRAWSWEIPRGGIETGASVADTVAAELREEIEADAHDFTDMGLVYGASGFMGLGVRLVIARISGFGTAPLGEGISEARSFSVPDVEAMIASGEITDSFTLAAFLRARLLNWL